MSFIIDFVINNFIWILIFIIVILLAIIGRYADQTNFGEGKKVVKVKKKKEDLIDSIEMVKEDDKTPEENNQTDDPLKSLTNNEDTNLSNNNEKIETEDITLDMKQEEQPTEEVSKESDNFTEEEFLESDNLDVLLPKKEVVEDDILEDLDDIDLEFKPFEFSKSDSKSKSISDLGNIDLSDVTKPRKKSTNLWK